MLSVLLLHAAATLAMTGLIWFVQIVHYPLLQYVGEEGFVRYEQQHIRLTTFVVGPLMLVEAGHRHRRRCRTVRPDAAALASTGLALLAVVWGSTMVLQVPCHRRLERRWDPPAARRLVATNWLRTAAWSARCVVALGLLLPGDRLMAAPSRARHLVIVLGDQLDIAIRRPSRCSTPIATPCS